jgi:ACS family D-galactonate transporter-like MFS transporter
MLTQSSVETSAAVITGAPSRARLGVLALITVATMVNYLDRAVMGVAAPAIVKDLGLSAVTMGVIFSAFSWTYTLAQIPGGVLLDKWGTRLTYAASLVAWSFFTLLHGIAGGAAALIGFRLGLGIAEAPCFPANSRVLGTWFPQHERARANSVYSVGMYFGLACFSPLLFLIVQALGWRVLFAIAGALGMAFGSVFWLLYRDPKQGSKANPAELELIAAGGGLEASAAGRGRKDGHSAVKFDIKTLGRLFAQRTILGASIGHFAGNVTLVFFLTWFPTYLANERHMDWTRSGVFTLFPYIAASLGVITGGFLSDLLIKRTGSALLGRKLPIVAGLLLASTMMAAGFVDSNTLGNTLVIAIASLAFFGQGMVNLGWTLMSDVAPKQFIGLSGGAFNLVGNIAGIVTPLVVGFVVNETGSFRGGLLFVGVVALAGAFAYIFMVREVRRIEFE